MSLGDEASTEDDDARRRALANLRALAHPVRMRILSLLTGADMSAAEIARELGITHANASYHVRLLRDSGLIDPAGEQNVRGGIARRYRYDVTRELTSHAVRRSPEDHPTREDAQLMYAALASELRRRAREVMVGPESVNSLTDAELWVDLEQWRDLRDRMNAISHELHHAAKAPRTPGTVRVSATIALFRMENP